MEREPLETRVQHRLNLLEVALCDNMHIRDPNAVQALLQKIAVHDAILTDEDRAYAHSAQRIIDEQIPYDDS
jgi:hypothetical protein|tara:strand:- start:615 stop:830 length:216 start_codon:yes stop_codon:yes gene_type:complete